MPESFEKSVKGATKIKLAPPKSKYIEHILVATHSGEAGVGEVFRVLQNRLRDSTWTIVFKSLIVVHLMIREGVPDVTLRFLSHHPQNKLAINNFTEGNLIDRALTAHGMPVQTQGRNIRAYADYLIQRAKSYAKTKVDYVKRDDGRLKRLTVDKGLLRETEEVQEQIWALLLCDVSRMQSSFREVDTRNGKLAGSPPRRIAKAIKEIQRMDDKVDTFQFLSHEPENEITLTAFRLLTMDLLALYYVMNEGTMNVLENFIEMSKPDAERALNIYKRFCKQTEQVISYLQVARNYEHATRLEIPKMKHAPTKLSSKLEEYIHDPDFDQNRRRNIAEKEAKKLGKKVNGTSSKPFGDSIATSSKANNSTFPDPKPSTSQTAPKKAPEPDLIDFFESIEQNQVPMMQQPQQQFQPQGGVPVQGTGFAQVYSFPQQTTGFQQQGIGFQPQSTGFQPQQFGATINGQGTNPFAQTSQPQQQQIQSNFTGAGFGGYTAQPQQQPQQASFQPTLSSIPQSGVASFQPQSQQQSSFTGSSVVASPTGSTNPFRQSMMPTGTSISSTSSIGFTPTGSTISNPTTFTSPVRQSTNPFAKTATPPQVQPFSAPLTQPAQPATSSPFSQSPFQSAPPTLPQPQRVSTLVPNPTGSTNPFAKPQLPTQNTSPFTSPPPVISNPTGSTNPFRQSAFVSQTTGQPWQQDNQGTIGGFNSNALGTTPVFPRPGQVTGQQQQQTGWQQ